MKREHVFETWKGKDHPWIMWVKPSLFERVEDEPIGVADESQVYRAETPPWAGSDTSWYRGGAAVIIDLPADEAVSLALALGQRGIRPVLSINACSASGELIPMGAVIELLSVGARFPSAFPFGAAVPPAFVLDSRRNADGRAASPGSFDNRWAIFGGDLPSAKDLRAEDVTRVIVVQRGTEVLGDLEAVLRGYQEGGIELLLRDMNNPGSLIGLTVAKRGWFSHLVDSVQRRVSLRRRWDGSFGRRVPIPPEPSHG